MPVGSFNIFVSISMLIYFFVIVPDIGMFRCHCRHFNQWLVSLHNLFGIALSEPYVGATTALLNFDRAIVAGLLVLG